MSIWAERYLLFAQPKDVLRYIEVNHGWLYLYQSRDSIVNYSMYYYPCDAKFIQSETWPISLLLITALCSLISNYFFHFSLVLSWLILHFRRLSSSWEASWWSPAHSSHSLWFPGIPLWLSRPSRLQQWTTQDDSDLDKRYIKSVIITIVLEDIHWQKTFNVGITLVTKEV